VRLLTNKWTSNRLLICKGPLKALDRPVAAFLGSDALSYQIGDRALQGR